MNGRYSNMKANAAKFFNSQKVPAPVPKNSKKLLSKSPPPFPVPTQTKIAPEVQP